MSKRKISAEELEGLYRKGELIGKGHYAEVYDALCVRTGKELAMKVMKGADAEKGVMEAEVLSQARHPHVLHVQKWYMCEEKIVMFSTKVHHTLKSFLISRGLPVLRDAKLLVKQLFSGLEYLHNVLSVAHRDVKAENTLVDISPTGRPVLQLIDLGLCCSLPAKDVTLPCSPVGTIKTMSSSLLEAVSQDQVNLYVVREELISWDVYAASVVSFNIICQAVPFQGSTPRDLLVSMSRGVSSLRQSVKYATLPPLQQAFLENSLLTPPSSALAVLSHEWLADDEEEDLPEALPDEGEGMYSAVGSEA
eukprot:TRINITY_DN18106_c2_g1_i1.p1 TRINITY_DN18106_c2_g1~~TRINITY_DN18106_c2_g1_i1.p1  ORF type:complete len:307 (+),score=44.65 TRINITY_DN18106_c2_g1_i1:49-969(+)